MWIRMKGTDQELNVPDVRAQMFVDNGEAVVIPTPPPKAQPAFAPATYPTRTVVPLPVEVRKLVQDLGLANQPQSFQWAKDYFDLKERVAQLERLVMTKEEIKAFIATVQPAAAVARR